MPPHSRVHHGQRRRLPAGLERRRFEVQLPPRQDAQPRRARGASQAFIVCSKGQGCRSMIYHSPALLSPDSTGYHYHVQSCSAHSALQSSLCHQPQFLLLRDPAVRYSASSLAAALPVLVMCTVGKQPYGCASPELYTEHSTKQCQVDNVIDRGRADW